MKAEIAGSYRLIKTANFIFFKNPLRIPLRHEPGFHIKKKFADLHTGGVDDKNIQKSPRVIPGERRKKYEKKVT